MLHATNEQGYKQDMDISDGNYEGNNLEIFYNDEPDYALPDDQRPFEPS